MTAATKCRLHRPSWETVFWIGMVIWGFTLWHDVLYVVTLYVGYNLHQSLTRDPS